VTPKDAIWYHHGSMTIGIVLVELEDRPEGAPRHKCYIGVVPARYPEQVAMQTIAQTGARFRPSYQHFAQITDWLDE
jgi:hypothetical protein